MSTSRRLPAVKQAEPISGNEWDFGPATGREPVAVLGIFLLLAKFVQAHGWEYSHFGMSCQVESNLVVMDNKFDNAVSLATKFCPGFRVKSKQGSWTQRVIGWVLGKVGNPEYMTQFITTIGQTVYWPDNLDKEKGWEVILHEGQHAIDSRRLGNRLFGTLYLFPQLIGFLGILYTLAIVPVLLAGGPLALLWGLGALIFLAPLPAPFRAISEVRAYTVSLAVGFWSGSLKDPELFIRQVVEILAGPYYYWAWPFRGWLYRYFQARLQELKYGNLKLTPYLTACRHLLRAANEGITRPSEQTYTRL